MTLEVCVVINNKVNTSKNVGGCSGFAEFKALLIKVIRGKDEADKYTEYIDAVCDHFMTENPLSLHTVNQYQIRKRLRRTFLREGPVEPDLDIFLEVHDIDGELSKEQCTKVLALFQKYRQNFMEDEEVKEEGYDKMFKEFAMLLGKVVRSKSPIAKLAINPTD